LGLSLHPLLGQGMTIQGEPRREEGKRRRGKSVREGIGRMIR